MRLGRGTLAPGRRARISRPSSLSENKIGRTRHIRTRRGSLEMPSLQRRERRRVGPLRLRHLRHFESASYPRSSWSAASPARR